MSLYPEYIYSFLFPNRIRKKNPQTEIGIPVKAKIVEIGISESEFEYSKIVPLSEESGDQKVVIRER